MLRILEKSECCGCQACLQACPRKCIAMKEDCEGFLYPNIDENLCIDCGLCEKVCPVKNKDKKSLPIQAFSAINNDKHILSKSSSGGIFAPLAENVLSKNGVVFGAKFDENWNVVHSYTQTKDGLGAFLGSKYVQSDINNAYKDVQTFLKDGRLVLFSGTSCQIAGLRKFLRKDYENLILVDVICHGVPSPKIWREYLQNVINKDRGSCIKSVEFRNKTFGWKNFALKIEKDDSQPLLEHFKKNDFMLLFLSDFILRPSCYKCPAKAGMSKSDITLGDFWGANLPSEETQLGVSAVIINTPKGKSLFEELKNIKSSEVNLTSVLRKNKALNISAKMPKNRNLYFKIYNSEGLVESIKRHKEIRNSFFKKVRYKIKDFFANLKKIL